MFVSDTQIQCQTSAVMAISIFTQTGTYYVGYLDRQIL